MTVKAEDLTKPSRQAPSLRSVTLERKHHRKTTVHLKDKKGKTSPERRLKWKKKGKGNANSGGKPAFNQSCHSKQGWESKRTKGKKKRERKEEKEKGTQKIYNKGKGWEKEREAKRLKGETDRGNPQSWVRRSPS